MIFRYLMEVEVKNDKLTHDLTPNELSNILQDAILVNDAVTLSWVLRQEIAIIQVKT